jgi:four helix bundle protein
MRIVQLDVWQRSIDLVIDIYDSTARFPKEETFGLQAQMRRAAVSIPSNVAEGEGRQLHRDQARFLTIARGSLYELHTQITIGERLGYLTADQTAALFESTTRVAKLINGTLRSLAKRS